MHTLSRINWEKTTGRAPQSCSGVNQTPPCGSGSNFSPHIEGYDGGSSESECESPILDEQECQSPLMPEFWLIVKIHQDRVKVYSHSRLGLPQKILLEHSTSSWILFLLITSTFSKLILFNVSRKDSVLTFISVVCGSQVLYSSGYGEERQRSGAARVFTVAPTGGEKDR